MTTCQLEFHWEHGYRCHGLLDQFGKRHALVSIGPPRLWKKALHGYSWCLDRSETEKGTSTDLRAAKREVEKRLALKPTK